MSNGTLSILSSTSNNLADTTRHITRYIIQTTRATRLIQILLHDLAQIPHELLEPILQIIVIMRLILANQLSMFFKCQV